MRFKLYICLFIVLSAVLIPGCSNNRFSAYREISGYTNSSLIQLDASYDKAVCDPQANVVFALSKATQEVHIFRDGTRINSIGGIGFERTNFQRLTDIAVDNDGGLLALDSAQKLLRKYSEKGGLVAELKFSALQQPELFCLSSDGSLFVYDSASSEIVCYSQLDASELYRFGRFELEQPVSIACNHDYLYAYSSVKNCSYVFYILGQYKETIPQQVIYDSFNNPIQSQDVIPVYSSELPKLMSITADTVCLLFNRAIRTVQVNYARGEDAAQ